MKRLVREHGFTEAKREQALGSRVVGRATYKAVQQKGGHMSFGFDKWSL